jgi:tetratricopeptide (TPR) repeat protein
MDTSSTSGLLHQAEALLDLGCPLEALQVAGMAASAQPPDATVHCVMATGHLAVGNLASAFADIKQATRLEPAWEWPHRLRAMALLRQAEDMTGRRARRLQKQAVTAAADAVQRGPVTPEAHCILGFARLTLGHIDAARAAARWAVELAPGEAAGWVIVSLVELTDGQWAAAAYAAQRALTLDPDDEAAMVVLASAQHHLGGAVFAGPGHGLSRAS